VRGQAYCLRASRKARGQTHTFDIVRCVQPPPAREHPSEARLDATRGHGEGLNYGVHAARRITRAGGSERAARTKGTRGLSRRSPTRKRYKSYTLKRWRRSPRKRFATTGKSEKGNKPDSSLRHRTWHCHGAHDGRQYRVAATAATQGQGVIWGQ